MKAGATGLEPASCRYEGLHVDAAMGVTPFLDHAPVRDALGVARARSIEQ